LALNLPISLTRTPLGSPDENLLFGRASEVNEIVENCRASRLSVVTGAAGMGMSSLLRAGVAPALLRAGFITVVITDWQGRSLPGRFREAIVLAIHEQGDGAFASAVEPLPELLERAESKLGRPIALVLDQFEDYLLCHSGTDVSDGFDAELSKAISARAGRFVIGLQVTEIEELHRLSQYIPNMMGYSFSLEPLTQDAAKQMIHAAAAHAELDLEPAAADLLVTAPAVTVPFVSGTPGVHPLYCRLAAERLFAAEGNVRSQQARAATVLANGGADRLIFESLDPVIDSMGSVHTELFFRWILLLIGKDGRRLPVSEAALLEHAGKWNRFGATLLPLLLKNGLLRTIEMPLGIRYEFTRESMAAAIKDWWNRKETDIIARQRAMFRVRSVSIAMGAIVLAYLIYLFVGKSR
jgi:hypothetical protein